MSTDGAARALRALMERRRLMRAATVAAGAAAMVTRVTGADAKMVTSAADADILNFALNLEYLEAEFYLRATTGNGLPASETSGAGTPGTVTGGSAVPFSSQQSLALAQEIARDEYDHVVFLRAALGAKAVAEPSIDLENSFTQAAIAAGLIQSGQTFSPFDNENDFLLGAYIFEDVGVSAYGGAAAAISSKTYLTAAAQILATEAYHAGSIRTRLYLAGYGAQTQAISNARAALSGTGGSTGIPADDHGVNYNGRATFVDADQNGLAYVRTTAQVLNIVYLGNAGGGGFFPNKLNGTIQ